MKQINAIFASKIDLNTVAYMMPYPDVVSHRMEIH